MDVITSAEGGGINFDCGKLRLSIVFLFLVLSLSISRLFL